MNDINVWAAIGLFFRVLSLSLLVFFIIPKQFNEVMRPKNWLTPIRIYILALFVLSIIAAVPSVTYQILRTFSTEEYDVLRNVAAITGNVSNFCITILILLIYNYKKKD